MDNHVRSFKFWVLGCALAGSGSLAGCLSDDSDPAEETGGSGGTGAGTGGTAAGTAGTSPSGGSGGSAGTSVPGTVCETPIVLPADKPAIADFDNYDGSSDLATWSFPLGGDTAIGVLAGTFGYGDDHLDASMKEAPEVFEMVDGSDSTYALGISDTLAEDYGGGLGLWISECLDATAFSGISFWVRGNSPTGDAKLSALMQETTSATATGSSLGTCPGDDMSCIHPSFTFPVTSDWAEVRVAWTMFTAGSSGGMLVRPDGHNLWQLQFDVGLVWVEGEGGVYEPTPSGYELAVDSITFY